MHDQKLGKYFLLYETVHVNPPPPHISQWTKEVSYKYILCTGVAKQGENFTIMYVCHERVKKDR